jgi:hypothetical protein
MKTNFYPMENSKERNQVSFSRRLPPVFNTLKSNMMTSSDYFHCLPPLLQENLGRNIYCGPMRYDVV